MPTGLQPAMGNNLQNLGAVDGNQTRRDLIDSQTSPSGGLYGIELSSGLHTAFPHTAPVQVALREYSGIAYGARTRLTSLKG